jgi:hypothetical protein
VDEAVDRAGADEKSPQPISEYACHEGNYYSLYNILAGARAKANAAEASPRKSLQ